MSTKRVLNGTKFIYPKANACALAIGLICTPCHAHAAPDDAHPLVVNSKSAVQKNTTPRLADLVGSEFLTLPNLDYEDTKNEAAANPNLANGMAEFVALSIQNSPQLRQANAQFETSQARVGVTRADLLPNASVRLAKGPEDSVSTQITGGSNKHTYSSKTYRLTQPLFNLAAFQEFAGSRLSRDAASLRLDAMREATALSAVKATVDLAIARITINFADQQLEQLNKILNYLEERASAGAASQADLERARTRVMAARQTRLEQQTNYRNAVLELARLTGKTPEALTLPQLESLPALPKNAQDVRQLINDQNFDLLALRKDAEAQKKQVSAEYSRYLPVVGVSLERDETKNVRGTNDPWTDTRGLIVVNWGFSLGGKEYYSAQQAGAELRNREAKLDDETQRTSQATEIDIAMLQSVELRLQAALSERDSATAVVTAVEAQLSNGRLGSLLEALDASDRLFAARARLTQTLGQQMKAHAQLLSRLGLLSTVQTQAKL
jgi:adhesin transport system outer membrane protein